MMDEAFVQAKKNAEVVSTYGEPMKVYGIDSGSKREGRRNFIQSREYEVYSFFYTIEVYYMRINNDIMFIKGRGWNQTHQSKV